MTEPGTYQVWGKVDVCITVEVSEDDELTIGSVNVMDEGLQVDGNVYALVPSGTRFFDDAMPLDEPQAIELRQRVQQDNSMWPGWEFGW